MTIGTNTYVGLFRKCKMTVKSFFFHFVIVTHTYRLRINNTTVTFHIKYTAILRLLSTRSFFIKFRIKLQEIIRILSTRHSLKKLKFK